MNKYSKYWLMFIVLYFGYHSAKLGLASQAQPSKLFQHAPFLVLRGIHGEPTLCT